MQQSFLGEMESLFLGESFQVACSSVLKEMAVSCDLTALEEVIPSLNFSPKKKWNNLWEQLVSRQTGVQLSRILEN